MSDEIVAPAETPAAETQTEAPAETEAKQPETPPVDKKQAAQEVKKYKLKVNGQEREVDEKMLIMLAQKGTASDENFRKAAERQKQVDAILSSKDPEKILKLLGVDPDNWSKERIKREIERFSMTPEQRELAELRERVAQAEKERQEREAKAKEEAQNKATQHFIAKYDKEIPDALKKVGLPVNEDTVRYTAETMLAIMDEGLDPDDVTYDVIMDAVKEKYVNSFRSFIKTSDVDKLWELLGQDIDGVVQERTKRSKSNDEKSRTKQSVSTKETKKEDNVFGNRDDFREYVRKCAENS